MSHESSVESRDPTSTPLPCPFCGGEEIDQDWYEGLPDPDCLVAWCNCEDCLAMGPEAAIGHLGALDTVAIRAAAVAAWNRRANAPDPSLSDPFDHPTPDFPLPPIPPEPPASEQ